MTVRNIINAAKLGAEAVFNILLGPPVVSILELSSDVD